MMKCRSPPPESLASSASSVTAVEDLVLFNSGGQVLVPNVRLDYGVVQRCGMHQQELHRLLDYATGAAPKPAIWVEAEAGVGKSVLLQRFRDRLRDTDCGCITISGKFEERAAASEPFAALREAISELAAHILSQQQQQRPNSKVWAEELQERLGPDADLVLGILPALRPCFLWNVDSSFSSCQESEGKHDESESEDAFGNLSHKEHRFVRFRLAFRSLIRLTCAILKETQQTLVMVLDDFHWIDPDSLQIVRTLMEDAKKPDNFFLLAATRPLDGFPHIQSLHVAMSAEAASQSQSTLSSVRSQSTRKHLHDKLLVMEVSKLSTAEIGSILRALLGRPDVDEFAEIVKAKTQGNSFVTIQFLRLLERLGHVFYSHDQGQWQFDVQSIAQVDQVSDNISEVVARSLESGDPRRRAALMVAASFGVSQFDVSTIVHAVTVLEKQEEAARSGCDDACEEDYEDPYVVRKRMQEMCRALTEAAMEGYVEESSPGHFRFAHDRIRESAYSLLPTGNSRKGVHLKVGRQLRLWMDTQSELGLGQTGFSKESLLLHATKQLNAGAEQIDDDWELLDLVDLNYQAAELAATKTAFFSAIEYLQMGLSHLKGRDAWSKHYDRTLKYHVALSRMQYSCGLLNDCWETSGAVISHAKTLSDKTHTYHTRILSLMQKELMTEALELNVEVLQLRGQPIPRRFAMLRAIRDMTEAQKFLKQTNDDELLNLPCIDERELATHIDFMQTLGELGFAVGNFGYVLLVSFHFVLLVKERGNYPRSFFATLFWAGLVKAPVGDFSEAMRYGTLATKLAAKQRSKVPGFSARADSLFISLIQHWQVPVRDSLAPLIDAFKRMWSCGMVDTALMDSAVLLQHYFAAGETVEKTLQACSEYSEAFEDYHQTYHWHINASQHQAMLNFQGRSDNPAVLKGDHMDPEECRENWDATSNKRALYYFQFWSLVLGLHFGDLNGAKRHIKAMRSDLMEDGPIVLVPLRLLYTGLVYLSLFRGTRKVKYRRRATKAWKQLQIWSKKGAANCVYMCQLLKAEDLSCQRASKDLEMTMEAYHAAIDAVTVLRLQHHMALANELAGLYLLSQNQDDRAATYLRNAVELYRKWGATAKVTDMQFKFKAKLGVS